MKNANLVGAVAAAIWMMGCAAEETTEPPTEDGTKAPAEAKPSADVEPEAAKLTCPPKPGYIKCSCGICAYESSCSTVCR